MRQRLQGFLPILLIALMVQILAPIGATWTAAAAASDPLRLVEICHADSAGSPAQDDGNGQHGHGACVLCCMAQAAASLDVPPPAIVTAPDLTASHVVRHAIALDLIPSRIGGQANARGPPSAI